MNRLIIAAAFALIAGPALAADAPPPKPVTVVLTAQDIQVITYALQTSGQRCGPGAESFCDVGRLSGEIIAKLNTAGAKTVTNGR